MIDIHSHIIPGIDDGAENKDIAISMLKKAQETGTKKIILNFYGNFLYIFTLNVKMKCIKLCIL